MTIIYSVDSAGRLYTDRNQHFYVDSDLLRERAAAKRTAHLLDQISIRLGYRSFDDLDVSARCAGVSSAVLMSWILAGRFEYISAMSAYMGSMKRKGGIR